MGDESRFVVRMANAISRNTVSCQVRLCFKIDPEESDNSSEMFRI